MKQPEHPPAATDPEGDVIRRLERQINLSSRITAIESTYVTEAQVSDRFGNFYKWMLGALLALAAVLSSATAILLQLLLD